jgi:predicted ATPase/transcriptional regulator with XRE-family HTH domain
MAPTSAATFGILLRQLRLAAGLTQEALAERAGLSARGVQDLERGLRLAPRAETVRLLADALGVSGETRAALITAAHPELSSPPAPVAVPLRLAAPPLPLTPLVDREREVATICARLRHPETRLVTLTGPGGVGKTRLALAVAAAMAGDVGDGVAWVDLAPLRDPTLVPAEVADALGVRERGEQPLAEVLRGAVAGRQLLLVLDSCEHVLPTMPLIGELLTASPDLTVLATSRARLRLRGEQELPVGPLAVPATEASTSALEEVAAVRLFVERAQAVAPAFVLTEATAAPVSEICRRVEGLPLALELAAVRVKFLSPAALLTRLERRLPLLSGGPRDAPDRQRTMRDTIAWSHDLLTPEEQTLFRRLAVFAGGIPLEAAEAVGGRFAQGGEGGSLRSRGERGGEENEESSGRLPLPPQAAGGHPPQRSAPLSPPSVLEGLATLLDQSLLRQYEPAAPSTGEARFAMLETVREYAMERLEASGEAEMIRQAHAAFYLALLEAAEGHLHGPDGPATLDRLETEHDNLRAALTWAIEEGKVEIALKLAHACWRFWWMHSHLDQGRLWLERALALPDPGAAVAALRPRVLVDAGYFARIQGAYEEAAAMGEEALAAGRAADDRNTMASALFLLGMTAFDRGELERARVHHEVGLTLEREVGNQHGVAIELTRLGDIAVAQGNLEEAETSGEEALVIWRERGDAWGAAWGLLLLGRVARARGDDARAIGLFRESLASNARLGDKEIIVRAVAELAAVACNRGQFLLAARLYGGVAALRETLGAPLAPAGWAGYEQDLAATRSELAEEVFQAAWDAGRALPLERIIAEAESLGDTALPTPASIG